MKLSKLEAKVLLTFLKANMDCDLDDAGTDFIPKHFKGKDKKYIKKTWIGIRKKLRSIK